MLILRRLRVEPGEGTTAAGLTAGAGAGSKGIGVKHEKSTVGTTAVSDPLKGEQAQKAETAPGKTELLRLKVTPG